MERLASVQIAPRSVALFGRAALPLMEAGLIPNPEYRAIMRHLTRLAREGVNPSPIAPRLLTVEETAAMLGISPEAFKMLEHRGQIRIPRRKVGRAVRYLNLRVLEYVLDEGEPTAEEVPGNAEI